MRWAYSPYELPLIASALICLAVVALVLPRRSAMGAASFALLPLTVAFWALANALEIAFLDLPVKLFWANLEYLSIVSVPVLWLVFALEYSRGSDALSRRTLGLLAVIPVITLALVWTDGAHGLVRRNIALDATGPFLRISKTYGPWFYVHTYSYLLIAVGAFHIVRAVLRSPRIYQGQAVALLVGCAVPWAVNAAYILDRSPLPPMDPTPMAFAVSCVAFAWGLLHWRLLDLVPVARAAVIEGMSDGLMVLDVQNRIVDLNPAACSLIGCTRDQAIGQPAARVLVAQAKVCARYRETLEVQEEITLGEIEQVIVNLLTNARDAMPGGGTPTIETASVELSEGANIRYLPVRAGRYVLLTIRDTGVGMTPKVKEHLFEPFFTTKEIGKGTGLGLPAVYGIVEEAGGCIDVTSEPGQGTTFKIYLPALTGQVEEATPTPSEPLARGWETVLVVEDEEAVRDLVVQTLERLGYSVLEARDGDEALRICREQSEAIDLVLTDVVMPRLNGQELARQLRRGQHTFGIVYISGHPEDTINDHGPLSEQVPLIRKPFTMEAIARAVRSALDARSGV